MRTQVGIVGAGPAGMFLALLLHRHGIDSIVVEQRDRAYVEGRVRAGVLEQNTVDVMRELSVADRLSREGLVHCGTNIAIDGSLFHIDFAALTGGKTVTVYGQQEVMRDLFTAGEQRGIAICWNSQDISLAGLEDGEATISFRHGKESLRVECRPWDDADHLGAA